MTDCRRLSVLAEQKKGRPQLGWEVVIKKDFREMRTSWEAVKREALNGLGRRRSWRSCVVLGPFGAVVSC